jgi:hypothetical protein
MTQTVVQTVVEPMPPEATETVQAPELLTEARLRRTLTGVLDCVLPAAPGAAYRLVGTGSSLLRSIRLPARDIDVLLQERRDVDAFGRALATLPGVRCLVPPAWLPGSRQYYATYGVGGVEVGLSTVEGETDSDGIECVGRGPWEHFQLLACGPHRVPAVASELRLVSELTRDRPDRYAPILEHLRAQGCDVALVQRGMAARRVPAARQREVLDRLAGE